MFNQCLRKMPLSQVAALLLLISTLGCGETSELRRVAVSGTVMVDELMIPDATVRFLPMAGNLGPLCVTSVKSGVYGFTKSDGPIPGKYKVVVNLELPSLTKMPVPVSETRPMMWEQEVVVPDEDSATQHLAWETEADESKETASGDPKDATKPSP